MATNELNQRALLEYRLEFERKLTATALKQESRTTLASNVVLEEPKESKLQVDIENQTTIPQKKVAVLEEPKESKSQVDIENQTATPEKKVVVLEEPKDSKSQVDIEKQTATPEKKVIVLEEPKDSKSQVDIEKQTVTPQKKVVKKKSPGHKEGVFSPLVFVAKEVMGANELKKFRAEIISYHSGGIKDFVNTYESAIGQKVVEEAFKIMDENNDGVIDDKELIKGLHALGFSWMDEKQIKGIVKKADKNKNGVLEFDEFNATVSKILKTNLLKLAKQNGDDMGLLV